MTLQACEAFKVYFKTTCTIPLEPSSFSKTSDNPPVTITLDP